MRRTTVERSRAHVRGVSVLLCHQVQRGYRECLTRTPCRPSSCRIRKHLCIQSVAATCLLVFRCVLVMILPVIFASLMFTTSGAGENSPGTSLGSSVVIMWSCIPTGCPVAAASLLGDVSIPSMLPCQGERLYLSCM